MLVPQNGVFLIGDAIISLAQLQLGASPVCQFRGKAGVFLVGKLRGGGGKTGHTHTHMICGLGDSISNLLRNLGLNAASVLRA